MFRADQGSWAVGPGYYISRPRRLVFSYRKVRKVRAKERKDTRVCRQLRWLVELFDPAPLFSSMH